MPRMIAVTMPGMIAVTMPGWWLAQSRPLQPPTTIMVEGGGRPAPEALAAPPQPAPRPAPIPARRGARRSRARESSALRPLRDCAAAAWRASSACCSREWSIGADHRHVGSARAFRARRIGEQRLAAGIDAVKDIRVRDRGRKASNVPATTAVRPQQEAFLFSTMLPSGDCSQDPRSWLPCVSGTSFCICGKAGLGLDTSVSHWKPRTSRPQEHHQ